MLARIKELIRERKDFGFETTLATRSYAPLLIDAKAKGYTLVLIFFWLESVELAKSRVKARVMKGGHNIPEETIERRYKRGMSNLINIYQNIVHTWIVYDNSKAVPSAVAKGSSSLATNIFNSDIWNSIHKQ